MSYQNPFLLPSQWNGNQLGDPFLYRFNGFTYLYCSSPSAAIKCWKSENLVDWQYVGSVCDLPEIYGAYAPEITYYAGQFYLVTSPVGSGHYILASDSPEGPFTLVTENFGQLIDGSFFIDDDGKAYLLRAGHRGIVIHDLNDFKHPSLHGRTIPESYLNHWTEGPMIIKRQGRYYLTYTGNHLLSRGYRVNYSVSETAPEEGYVNLPDNTLLLEVGDEFHALGHSSCVLGPDMDSWYIAYHSYDLRPEKRHRSLNIDRVFFNGARMYVNAAWWEQASPEMPWFTARDGKGLKKDTEGRYSSPEIVRPFTAEAVLLPDSGGVWLTVADIYTLHIRPDGHFIFSREGVEYLSGTIPKAISLTAPLAVRMAFGSVGRFDLWLNQLHMGSCGADFTAGRLAIAHPLDHPPSFIGISYTTDGSGDYRALKSVPGRFDAAHYQENEKAVSENFQIKGMTVSGMRCVPGSRLVYTVNVKSAGEYLLFTRVKTATPFRFTVNGLTVGSECHAEDTAGISGGFILAYCGVLTLPGGISQLTVEGFNGPLLLDYFMLTPRHVFTPGTIIHKGCLAEESLTIWGHKKDKSMIPKSFGFTCAENYGMAFWGETGWTDYRIHADIHAAPLTEGSLTLFFRVTRESWFPHQAETPFFGYALRLNRDGLRLFRCAYGEKEILFCAMDWNNGEPCVIGLDITVSGRRITINNGFNTVTYEDPEAYGHGKIGFDARGEGYGLLSLAVEE